MCNRLPEINKNGDAGIFPVYYSRPTSDPGQDVTLPSCILLLYNFNLYRHIFISVNQCYPETNHGLNSTVKRGRARRRRNGRLEYVKKELQDVWQGWAWEELEIRGGLIFYF